jgi:hypothetical protein
MARDLAGTSAHWSSLGADPRAAGPGSCWAGSRSCSSPGFRCASS